jgi:hypothetical protein
MRNWWKTCQSIFKSGILVPPHAKIQTPLNGEDGLIRFLKCMIYLRDWFYPKHHKLIPPTRVVFCKSKRKTSVSLPTTLCLTPVSDWLIRTFNWCTKINIHVYSFKVKQNLFRSTILYRYNLMHCCKYNVRVFQLILLLSGFGVCSLVFVL